MWKTTRSLVALTLLILGAAACGNPASNVPAAEVAAVPDPVVAAASQPAVAAQPAALEVPVEGAQRYVLSPASTITWVGSKITRSHDGGFKDFTGDIYVRDGQAAGSSVVVRIDTASLFSDTAKLTGHLKSPDFFGVVTFPIATFTSTNVAASGDGYTVTGDLALHGVTKRITFPATITVSGDTVTAQAEFAIKRFDWEIVYKGMADDLIRDDVVIRLNLTATPA